VRDAAAAGARIDTPQPGRRVVRKAIVEAWWRSLKHRRLFLHPLDNIATVKKLVEFYVTEHNERIPYGS
jgi:hypothetical protein